VKINSADFQEGGFSEEDSLEVVRWLDAEGIDLLEISGG
jgi:2,4-dienoyl-CoA reductase-like NADH-dependent reductase (Old Yellow Enzyme family)